MQGSECSYDRLFCVRQNASLQYSFNIYRNQIGLLDINYVTWRPVMESAVSKEICYYMYYYYC